MIPTGPATARAGDALTRPPHALRRVALALMTLAALLAPAQQLLAQTQGLPEPAPVRLPALGESAAEDITVAMERKLGDQIMAEIRRDPDYLDDPVLLEYLDGLWQPLVQAARTRGDIEADTAALFAWEAFLVRDKSVNAFALPGGFVGVHLGLIAMTASRDELASVLAHELTHVTQRHIARSIVSQQRGALLSMAALVLGLLAASRSNNPDVAQAAIAGGQAAMIQGQLNFSRDMEREADRIGFALLAQAGYDGHGMATMFDKLEQANRLNDSGSFPYLRSHPLSFERQAEARLRMQGGAASPARASTPLLHALMGARARVLMDANPQSLRRLQEPPMLRAGQGTPEHAAALVAGALASVRLRDTALAKERLHQARALLGDDVDPAALRLLAFVDAETRLAAGDAAGTLQRLAELRSRDGGTAGARPALLMQAQAAALLQGPGREAALREVTESLQTWVAAHPRDALAWHELGHSAEALGLRLRALRAQAEARLLLGDMTGAIDRLRSGRNLSRGATAGQDFIEASIIDSRLRALEAQRRQQAAEARRSRGGPQRGPNGETDRETDRGEPPPARDDTQAPPRAVLQAASTEAR
ncbi:MAG: M48 family metalloprotease [Rubrivivax sp.]|nr:M48 family metalloprotease [Rubrivivax sp.]